MAGPPRGGSSRSGQGGSSAGNLFSREGLSRALAAASTNLQTIASAASEQQPPQLQQAHAPSQEHPHPPTTPRAYIGTNPQEFVKVPRSSFERIKYWYKADLASLVETHSSDKETLLAENDALRSALSPRLASSESVESVLPDKGSAVERVRETEDGVNRILLASATQCASHALHPSLPTAPINADANLFPLTKQGARTSPEPLAGAGTPAATDAAGATRHPYARDRRQKHG